MWGKVQQLVYYTRHSQSSRIYGRIVVLICTLNFIFLVVTERVGFSRVFIPRPELAAFLSANSEGHIAAILLIWLFPIIYYGYVGKTAATANSVKYRQMSTGIATWNRWFWLDVASAFTFCFLIVGALLSVDYLLTKFVFLHGEFAYGLDEFAVHFKNGLAVEMKNPTLTYIVCITMTSIAAASFAALMNVASMLCTREYLVCPVMFVLWLALIAQPQGTTTFIQPFTEYSIGTMIQSFVRFELLTLVGVFGGYVWLRRRWRHEYF